VASQSLKTEAGSSSKSASGFGRTVVPRKGLAFWQLALALLGLVVIAAASLFIGAIDVSVADLLSGDSRSVMVFAISRIPRLAAILLAGSALSVAGLIMQHLTRNKFVAPSTAGTVEWVLLGILLCIMFMPGSTLLARMGVATVFALVGTFAFIYLINRIQFTDIIVVPLVGIMFGGVIAAVTTFLAFERDLLQSLKTWTAGDFSGILQGRYEIIWVVLAVMVVAYVFADRFTVAGMGETFAKNLGVSYNFVLAVGMVIVSITVAVVTVVVGAIPFLGLIVPNIVTMIFGDNLRRVLPLTAIFGGGFVLICDIIGRLIRPPYEIPVGTVAGVIGSAIFITMIVKARKRD
jgi:iron complex transport system permease protein